MSRRITFLGVVRFTDRVLVAGYSPSEADDSLIIKEVSGGEGGRGRLFIVAFTSAVAFRRAKNKRDRGSKTYHTDKLPNGSCGACLLRCSTAPPLAL